MESGWGGRRRGNGSMVRDKAVLPEGQVPSGGAIMGNLKNWGLVSPGQTIIGLIQHSVAVASYLYTFAVAFWWV